jgi:allantoinase
MKIAAGLGLPVAVHAESDALTAYFSQKLRSQGKTTWRDYLASRPVFTELEAIARALVLARATGCKLHIVHISSGSGVVLAAEAKARGVDVSLETCPHYLAFGEADLERLGALGKCAPPLRGEAERDLLWAEVLRGSLDLIGSDHSPSPPELKKGDDFFALWGGIAGVQSTLGVLLSEGWQRLGLPLEAVARMLADRPARRFGLERKGRLEPGYDADFTLVDLRQSFTLRPEDLFYRHKLSPYLGKTFTGLVRQTFVRGQEVFVDGTISPVSNPTLIRPRRPQ